MGGAVTREAKGADECGTSWTVGIHGSTLISAPTENQVLDAYLEGSP